MIKQYFFELNINIGAEVWDCFARDRKVKTCLGIEPIVFAFIMTPLIHCLNLMYKNSTYKIYESIRLINIGSNMVKYFRYAEFWYRYGG